MRRDQEREQDTGDRQAAVGSEDKRRADGPLDGSVSGTIGGGGPETGGPTRRAPVPDTPPARAENAASGRLAPDPIAAGVERERIQPVPTAADREAPRDTKKRPR